MKKFKKKWEITKNWQLLFPLLGLAILGYSSFKRTFTLPDTVESDKIKAKYSEGILSVHLPKREEAKQKPAKRISVS